MTDSPFGSVKPENLPTVKKSVGFGRAFTKGAPRKKKTDQSAHYRRAMEYMEAKHGGYFWKCDGKKANAAGMLVSTDLLGIADIQGVDTDGRLIMVNVTAAGDAVKAHLRDYSNKNKTHGQAKTPLPYILRRLFANNVRVVILGYYQDGGKGSTWKWTETPVDEPTLQEYEARKRK